MRWLLTLNALLLLAGVSSAQAWLPALARPTPVPTCDRFGGAERFQLFWQRDRPVAPYGDLEIRDILLQWPGVLRRLDRLELGLRADPYAVPRDPYLPRVPLPRVDPYVPPLGVDPYLPRDPYGPRVDPLCPRCPPLGPRVDPYVPRVDPYVPVPRVDPYLPRDYMPPAVANPLNGYQRYQGANAVRR